MFGPPPPPPPHAIQLVVTGWHWPVWVFGAAVRAVQGMPCCADCVDSGLQN